MFDINFDTVISLLLPVHLRQTVMELWLKTLIKPLKQLFNVFTTYRNNQLLAMSYTGQVMYLKKLLDDIYDPNNRRFSIIDVSNDVLFLSNDELTPDITPEDGVGKIYFANPEYYANNIDFHIEGANDLPLQPTKAEVSHYINKYKLAGKNYDIAFIYIGIGD